MTLPRPSECRDCREPIRFVKLDTGRALPVNPRPGTTGNVAARSGGAGRLTGYVLSEAKPARESHPLRFIPHFATCSEQARIPRPPSPDAAATLF